MAKYTKEVEIDAVQFTGNNWKTVQDFVGSRTLDPIGKYSFPLFDEADTWMPERYDRDVKAVLQVRGTWQEVHSSDWIVRDPETQMLSLMSDTEFINTYGEPVATKKSTARRTRKSS